MHKTLLASLAFVVISIALAVLLRFDPKGSEPSPTPPIDVVDPPAASAAPAYFGNEVAKDLDGDGTVDRAFLVTRGVDGHTRFLLVGELATASGTQATKEAMIGDDIAPQTTESGPGRSVIVNFAQGGDGTAARPSVGRSARLLLDQATLEWGEVVPEFEGEADPSRMTLHMKTWEWVSAMTEDGRTYSPKKQGVFTLAFGTDGRVAIGTDCNSMGASYVAKGAALELGPIMSTLMFCDGSQEGEFSSLVSGVATYRFTGKGELVLGLKADSGTMTFR